MIAERTAAAKRSRDLPDVLSYHLYSAPLGNFPRLESGDDGLHHVILRRWIVAEVPVVVLPALDHASFSLP